MSEAPSELLAALGDVRSALTEAGVEHAFIGALPVLAWGRPRATTDLDLVVSCEPATFARLEAALGRRGLKPGQPVGPAEPSDSLPDIAVFWTGGRHPVRVDVFIAKMDFEHAVLATAQNAEILGGRLVVASCEASIVYKLLANRAKDIADVESMFEARQAIGARLDWSFLERWAAEWGIGERLESYRAKYGAGP